MKVMKHFNKVGLLALLLSLGACHSGWDKDPFDGEKENIKKAVEPGEEITKIPPPESNVLFIDMSSVYSVIEGGELEIPVRYKIAHPEVELSGIDVLELEDKFPQAVFDQEKSVLRIQTSHDYVPVDAPYVVEPLTIAFRNVYQGQEQEVKKTIVIHVLPENTQAPIIKDVRIEGVGAFGSVVAAGETRTVTVFVKDSSTEYSPRIRTFDHQAFRKSIPISQFVNFLDDGVYNPQTQLWEIEGTLTLPPLLHVEQLRRDIALEFYAYSVTGVPSRGIRESFRVNPDGLAKPVMVAEPTIRFALNSEASYTITAFDPRGQGDVSLSCPSKPNGMRCICGTSNVDFGKVAYCTLNWTPKSTSSFRLKMRAINKVGNFGTTVTKTLDKEFTLAIRREEP